MKPLYTRGLTSEFLKTQWLQQINEQTKPLKKQSKNLANKEIETILCLLKTPEEHKQEANDLQAMLETGDYKDGITADEIQMLLEEAHQHAKQVQKSVSSKKSKLSVDGRLNLTKLIGNVFLKNCMNALALKECIRDRLRQCKFELENLERAYRKTINHLKLEKHAQDQVKRKEPGIQTLARKYNNLCGELIVMIKEKKAPRGAIGPVKIDMETLFKLDVDDDIWQDIGLTNTDSMQNIPAWLGDKDVRKGIKALLEFDRCEEEKRRLIEEHISMQQWMREEWIVICKGIKEAAEDSDIAYQFAQRQKLLLRLCVKLQPLVQIIPFSGNNCWGPSVAELEIARSYEFDDQVLYDDDDIVVEDEEDTDNVDLDEAELFDTVEIMSLEDQYSMY